MGNQRIKPHQRRSLIAGQSKKRLADVQHDMGLVFSLKHFDVNQGQSFSEWESAQLLADMMTKFHGFCQRDSHIECRGESFTVYGNFPQNSKFKYPALVPEDAEWARIHIKGKPCVAGHIFRNIFYIVFLDKNHDFWPIDLQER
jgi:hypothetical protein